MTEIEKKIKEIVSAAQTEVDKQLPGLQVTVVADDTLCRRCWDKVCKFSVA